MTTTALPMTVPDSSLRGLLRNPRQIRIELLAGLVTALALIPEVLSFAVIAGVDPRVGLFTACIMAMTAAVVGGRPGMVTAAAGATALVVAPLVEARGLPYLVAAVLLGGLIQVALGLAGFGKVMRFIPRSVMLGFVNGLSVLIFAAQLPHLIGVPWAVYPMAAFAILMIIFLPKITKAVPAPLVSILLLTVFCIVAAVRVPNVGDQGNMPEGLPQLTALGVPLTVETLKIIGPYAVAIALVGLMESLLTAKLVDDITDTRSSKTRESWGQGVSNIVAALFGGMGGCAMIGQTMVNVLVAGGRTRLSAFLAGFYLLILVVVLSDWVAQIPMVALAAVMIMVAIGTFSWHSVSPATLRRMPKSETAVMVITAGVTIATHNLAIGVGTGVLSALALFARRVAHFTDVERTVAEDGTSVRYVIRGELFFASSNDLTTQFSYVEDPATVIIDLSQSHIWDASSVATLDGITTKYASKGKTVEIVGLNRASADRHDRLAGHLDL